ncbi:MAG TPA: HypC/HybG/HupF family hydrogenase formation chaperone [Opitutaceae bacterium]|nr:HypC/HybG/HupF family hydrogenase formation chaperone [Opitutaceae bacterium]
MCLAVPGKLLDVRGPAGDPLLRSGRASFGGVIKEVSLACTPEAKAGDYVLVHVGVAISVVDPAEAEQTLRYLREMGELAELETETAPPSAAPP